MSAYSETLYVNCSMAGQYQITRTGETKVNKRVQTAAAKSGVVTSNAEGSAVLTLGADHGITDADIVGVFWAAGQRVDVTVSAYDATTITITVATGTGDAIPAATTAVTVGVRVQETDITFAAAGLQKLTVGSPAVTAPASAVGVNFTDADDVSLLHAKVADGEAYLWASNNGPANPITGTVAKMNCYSGKTAAAEVVIGAILT